MQLHNKETNTIGKVLKQEDNWYFMDFGHGLVCCTTEALEAMVKAELYTIVWEASE
jgi:hypothetical protein